MDHSFLIAHRPAREPEACNLTRLFASLKGADDDTLLKVGAAMDWHLPSVGWTRYRGESAHQTAFPHTIHPYSALINSGNERAVELLFKPGHDQVRVMAETVSGPNTVKLPHYSDDYRQWGVYRDAIIQGNLTALKRLLSFDLQRGQGFPSGQLDACDPWVALAKSCKLNEAQFKEVLTLLVEHTIATTFVRLKPGQKAPRGFRNLMRNVIANLKNQVLDEACKVGNGKVIQWLMKDPDVVVDLDQVATLAGVGAMELAWSLIESFPALQESKRRSSVNPPKAADYPIGLVRTLGRYHAFLEHQRHGLSSDQVQQQWEGAQRLRNWLFEQAVHLDRWNLFAISQTQLRTQWNEAATLALCTFPSEEGEAWAHKMKAASCNEIVKLIQADKVSCEAAKVRVKRMQGSISTYDLFRELAGTQSWRRRDLTADLLVNDIDAFERVCVMRKDVLPHQELETALDSWMIPVWKDALRQWKAQRVEQATQGMAESAPTKPRF